MEVLFLTVILSVAVFCDMRERKIPNVLILSGWGFTFVSRLIQEGISGGLQCMVAVVMTIAVCFPFFSLRVIGAGDIKLLSVIGAMHGLGVLWQVTVVWLFIAGTASIVVMLRRRLVMERLRHIWFYLTVGRVYGIPYYDENRDGRKCTIILAPAMLLAYLLVQLGRWRGIC